MTSEELGQIVSDLQKGVDAEENFRRIYLHFHERIYRFFARRAFSAEESLDLTQEAFLRVYKGIGSFRGESSFETWLFGILANLSRNALRRRQAFKRSAPEVPIDEASRGPRPEDMIRRRRHSPGIDPAEKTLWRERSDLLEQAIAELPQQMRRVLILRVYHDLSYQEVAESLGLAVDTVKSHLHRGRRRLRDALE